MNAASHTLKYLLVAVATLVAQAPRQPAQAPATAAKKSAAVPAKKPVPQMVTVTVTTDVDCGFTVDGKPVGEVRVGEPRKVPLSRREHKLEAVSSAASQDLWTGAIDLSKTGTKPVVSVELLPIQNKRLEEERKAEEDRKAASPSVNLAVLGERVVQIVKDGLASEFRMRTGLVTTDRYPLRILLGYGRDKAIELVKGSFTAPTSGPTITFRDNAFFVDKTNPLSTAMGFMAVNLAFSIVEPVVASSGAVTMLWPDDFVINGHKVVFTGARLEKGSGPAYFAEGSRATWDGGPLVFNGREWLDRTGEMLAKWNDSPSGPQKIVGIADRVLDKSVGRSIWVLVAQGRVFALHLTEAQRDMPELFSVGEVYTVEFKPVGTRILNGQEVKLITVESRIPGGQ